MRKDEKRVQLDRLMPWGGIKPDATCGTYAQRAPRYIKDVIKRPVSNMSRCSRFSPRVKQVKQHLQESVVSPYATKLKVTDL